MVHGTSGAVKVIDPEFCVYGPPGLDVGSLISGLVLAAIRHIFKAQPDFTAAWRMADSIDLIWKTYAGVLAKQGLSAKVIEGINSDTVGFACCEVLRTALGFAGARGLKFEDKDKERQAQDVAVKLSRYGFQKMLKLKNRKDALVKLLRKAISDAGSKVPLLTHQEANPDLHLCTSGTLIIPASNLIE